VKDCHDTFYAAHFGISMTLDRIKKDFHWYKMSEDVKIHVKCCTVCNRFKSLNKKPRTALQKYLVGHPMARIGIDVIGLLPKSKNNNRYIFVIGVRRFHNGQYIHEPISQQWSQLVGLKVGTLPSNE
jgi:hypothetical protein